MDRPWSVYALGDLTLSRFGHCTWICSTAGSPALVLLYRAFTPPVLFTLGAPATLRVLLGEIRDPPKMHLHVRPETLPLLEGDYRILHKMEMWRMILEGAALKRGPEAECRRLSPIDLPALQRLYADGKSTGESPDFFAPEMLQEAVYFGAFDGVELIAAAGTHLVAEEQGVAAVGNVYTRRDKRGRGLATRLVAAVAGVLRSKGIQTVALNVAQDNKTAIRAYERVGFVRYCDFVEGLAVRLSTGST
jgi:ribosomal protein S18 acetylase RimI-like enzyme